MKQKYLLKKTTTSNNSASQARYKSLPKQLLCLNMSTQPTELTRPSKLIHYDNQVTYTSIPDNINQTDTHPMS